MSKPQQTNNEVLILIHAQSVYDSLLQVLGSLIIDPSLDLPLVVWAALGASVVLIAQLEFLSIAKDFLLPHPTDLLVGAPFRLRCRPK